MAGEDVIKAAVLNRIIEGGKFSGGELFFSEMNLAGKSRRLDLGYIQGQTMTAIEIKSEKDSLYRLSGQLAEYRKYFDKVILVVAPKFVSSAIAEADEDVTIWQFSNGEITVIRKGRLIRSVKKESYLDLMTKREISILARRLGIHPRDQAMYDLKQAVLENLKKLSKAEVKGVLIDGVYRRFGMASNRFLFKVARQNVVESRDIKLLSPHRKLIEV